MNFLRHEKAKKHEHFFKGIVLVSILVSNWCRINYVILLLFKNCLCRRVIPALVFVLMSMSMSVQTTNKKRKKEKEKEAITQVNEKRKIMPNNKWERVVYGVWRSGRIVNTNFFSLIFHPLHVHSNQTKL